jgi:soluble lytic murein transglycosylase-like protein
MKILLPLATVLFITLANGSMCYANTSSIDTQLRQALKSSIDTADSFTDRFDAEVWLVSTSEKLKRYIKDPKKRLITLQKIHHAATKEGLEPELVLAVIQIESAFNPYAVSRVGAQGMMQVMPFGKKRWVDPKII